MALRPLPTLLVAAAVPLLGASVLPGLDSSPARPAHLTAHTTPAASATSRPAAVPRRAEPRGFLTTRVRAGRTVTSWNRPGGRRIGRLGPRSDFGSPQVLSVAQRRGRWLGVVTSSRPNGKLAWVRRTPALRLSRLRYSLHADLSRRRLLLRRDGRAVEGLRVAIGRPGSPTPTGRFAVTDKIRGDRFGSYYGCCILALSGHQPRPPAGWRGGTRLAIHGTNTPGTIGSAASAGCLRAGDRDLLVLMRRVPLGTPVFIHP